MSGRSHNGLSALRDSEVVFGRSSGRGLPVRVMANRCQAGSPQISTLICHRTYRVPLRMNFILFYFEHSSWQIYSCNFIELFDEASKNSSTDETKLFSCMMWDGCSWNLFQKRESLGCIAELGERTPSTPIFALTRNRPVRWIWSGRAAERIHGQGTPRVPKPPPDPRHMPIRHVNAAFESSDYENCGAWSSIFFK